MTSAATVGTLSGAVASVGAVLRAVVQDAPQGALIPTALTAAIIGGLMGWFLWRGRIQEWTRQQEAFGKEYRAQVAKQFDDVRGEMRQQHERLAEKIDHVGEEHRDFITAITQQLADTREIIIRAVAEQRGWKIPDGDK